jgi:hypothetical protein
MLVLKLTFAPVDPVTTASRHSSQPNAAGPIAIGMKKKSPFMVRSMSMIRAVDGVKFVAASN